MPELDVKDLKGIPLVFAGWLRYLMGVDDKGNEMALSSDPMLETVHAYVRDIRLGDEVDIQSTIAPILKMKNIFGVDLYAIGLGEKVEEYFKQMIKGVGCVEQVLKDILLGV